MKFLNKIKRIQVHRENSLNQPTDLAEEAKIVKNTHRHRAKKRQEFKYTLSKKIQSNLNKIFEDVGGTPTI
jgi:hypothetical protein